MTLTSEQEYMFALVKRFRCLREAQVLILTRRAFERSIARNTLTNLYALRGYAIRGLPSGCAAMIGANPDPGLIAAVDIMLTFPPESVIDYRPGEPPVKLDFIKLDSGGQPIRYAVVSVTVGQENTCNTAAQTVDADTRIIFALLDGARRELIRCVRPFTAAASERGKTIFFRGDPI